MLSTFVTPLNLSKLGFRYFRIVLESKLFSKKFIQYLVSHPNTGYVFEGKGWSGKKRVLGIGIWATSNAEITDIATHIRAVIPDSYKVVYQSELTRLEYFAQVGGQRKKMVLLDELEIQRPLSELEKDLLKLISIDGSLTNTEIGGMLGISASEVGVIANKLKTEEVYYGVLENTPLPKGYTKFFVDTATLSSEKVEQYYTLLANDPACIYLARGNGKYNLEFEYVVEQEDSFYKMYEGILVHSKQVRFEENIYTNLFPQSKSINSKVVQNKFIELAKTSDRYFDFRSSELWYVNHDGTRAYLDIYSDPAYKESMKAGEVGLFAEVAEYLKRENKKYNVIDLGSGDGQKALELIKELQEERIKAYFPVDIQELELAQAMRTHRGASYALHPTMLGFDKLSARFPLAGSGAMLNVFLLFGGTYGNFPREQINAYLEKALNAEDKLLVAMPIRDFTSKEAIVRSYLNQQVEQVGFGVLKQIGFKREDFVPNATNPQLILKPKWIGDTLVQSFELRHGKTIHGVRIEAGTEFDAVSSWKPTLAEFKVALEERFVVEDIIKNKSFAIGMCRKRG